MSQIEQFLANLPAETLWLVGLAIAAPLLAPWIHRARTAYARWMIDRAIAQFGAITKDHARSIEQAAGEAPGGPDFGKAIGGALWHVASVALVPFASAVLFDAAFLPLFAGAIALVGAYYGWRLINDPPGEDGADFVQRLFPEAEVPQEAVVGFVGAVAFVGAIIAFTTLT